MQHKPVKQWSHVPHYDEEIIMQESDQGAYRWKEKDPGAVWHNWEIVSRWDKNYIKYVNEHAPDKSNRMVVKLIDKGSYMITQIVEKNEL